MLDQADAAIQIMFSRFSGSLLQHNTISYRRRSTGMSLADKIFRNKRFRKIRKTVQVCTFKGTVQGKETGVAGNVQGQAYTNPMICIILENMIKTLIFQDTKQSKEYDSKIYTKKSQWKFLHKNQHISNFSYQTAVAVVLWSAFVVVKT